MENKKEVFPKVHIGIKVSDLEASIVFYTQFFGITPSKVKENYVKFMLDEPALVLSFSQKEGLFHNNTAHYGIQVGTQESLAAWKAGITKRKLPIHSEEDKTKCCYALQDKFWVKDPDGNKWEVYFFHGDVEENDSKYSAESKVGNKVGC